MQVWKGGKIITADSGEVPIITKITKKNVVSMNVQVAPNFRHYPSQYNRTVTFHRGNFDEEMVTKLSLNGAKIYQKQL